MPNIPVVSSQIIQVYPSIESAISKKDGYVNSSSSSAAKVLDVETRVETMWKDILNQLRADSQHPSLKDSLYSYQKNSQRIIQHCLDEVLEKKEEEPYLKLYELRQKIEIKVQKAHEQVKYAKKLSDLGFDEKVVFSCFEFVDFLFKSQTIFWMACFRNSTKNGKQVNDIIVKDGIPHIYVSGQLTSWNWIKDHLVYDAKADKIVSKDNSSISWSYISTQGLVAKDRFEYDEIYPVDVLSEDEYERLKAHAKKFYETNDEQDPGKEKEAILQVVTTFRTKWWGIDIPENRLTKNLVETFPRHVTLRLVDKNKQVYSFGFEMKKEESERVTCLFPPTILKTATTKISAPDYEEPRSFNKRHVTSLPLTQERASNILQYVTEQNKKGVRFNFMKQNCTKLAGETLALAGHRVDTRISFGNLFGSMMPDLQDIPVVGKPLSYLCEKIMQVIGPILLFLQTHTPDSLKAIICFIPEKISMVLINLFILTIGGATMTSPLNEGEQDERDNSQKLARFSRIVRSPLDLFRAETCDINYSQAIVDWQEKQQSTVISKFNPRKPQLNLLP